MTLRTFLRAHRKEIDAYIKKRTGVKRKRFSDSERYEWLLGDETLSHWARSQGVQR